MDDPLFPYLLKIKPYHLLIFLLFLGEENMASFDFFYSDFVD